MPVLESGAPSLILAQVQPSRGSIEGIAVGLVEGPQLSGTRRNVRAELATKPRLGLVFDGEEHFAATEYLVDGVIPAEGAGMLFGETNVGKTTVAISIARLGGGGLAT